jgi:DNA-binding transcriptional regulator PaaX
MKVRPRTYLPMKALVLRALAIGGVAGLAVLAPNTLQLIKKLDRTAARRKNLYRNIRLTLWRLEHAGLVKSTGSFHLRSYELTSNGHATIDAMFAAEYRIAEPAFWDGKWRILAFDIKEKRRKTRYALRVLLRNAGFVRLQDSVWVFPYPCDEFIELVRTHLKSGTGEMQYFVAETLESDRALCLHFNLAP